jgi:hypothetical protein
MKYKLRHPRGADTNQKAMFKRFDFPLQVYPEALSTTAIMAGAG